MNKRLREEEIENLCFSDDSDRDPDYKDSGESSDSDDSSDLDENSKEDEESLDLPTSENNISDSTMPTANTTPNDYSMRANTPMNLSSHEIDERTSNVENTNNNVNEPTFSWTVNQDNFIPRINIPAKRDCVVMADVDRSTAAIDIFLKLFPRSLFIQISHFTNMRLAILEGVKGKEIYRTSPEEIMIVLGCMLVMSYNKVPSMRMYWSRNESLGNITIKRAISRDRFQLIFSKMYYNNPEKPEDASKIYYVEEVLSSFKEKFLIARTDSTFQSIDESMAKLKGRSALKQYLPMKPVKRGIKLWTRCDAETGYVYDTNIYHGKETEIVEGTLGERVKKNLASSIQDKKVVLCFDRFFTSLNLMNSLDFAAVGTCMRNRRNVPKFNANIERGECEIRVCKEGIICARWKDTKDVILLSNCHGPDVGNIKRTMKDGTKKTISCPEAIVFYNKYMGGVDHADQMITLYDLDRKSTKWWRKVFIRLMLTAVFNSYVIHCETNHKKTPYIDFLVDLAEGMIDRGRATLKRKRSRSYGRPSAASKKMEYVGDHLPVKDKCRRRCVRCTSRKREKRTQYLCIKCNLPLCMDCFTPYHT